MKYTFRIFLLCAIAMALFTGCSIDGMHGHVEYFEMEVPAAPEVRGASGFQKPNTRDWRGSINVHAGVTERERLSGIRNDVEPCSNVGQCPNTSKQDWPEDVYGTYKITFPRWDASLDILNKYDLFLWSFGFSYNDGLFSYVSIGMNTPSFEFGAGIGLWIMGRNYEYAGTNLICLQDLFDEEKYTLDESDFSASSGISNVFTYNVYASVFYKAFSLNYSVTAYTPVNDANESNNDYYVDAGFSLPLVLTEYITASYRINKNWEVRAGAINVFGNFPGWHWAATSGITYYFK